MSDKKAVFFDADGTICDMEKRSTGQCSRINQKAGCQRTSGMALYGEEAGRLYPGIWNRFRLQASSVHVGRPSKKTEKDWSKNERTPEGSEAFG